MSDYVHHADRTELARMHAELATCDRAESGSLFITSAWRPDRSWRSVQLTHAATLARAGVG